MTARVEGVPLGGANCIKQDGRQEPSLVVVHVVDI